ncbi:MAG TPA: cupin domain-containing protein [Ktedonobacteraceae bacterium]|nr:cupin domain-containing protein [Ktedonobacteraceae bacterium]
MNQVSENQAVQEEQKQGKPGEMVVFDLRALTHFRDEGPYVQVLSDIGTARLVLFAFKAGQQLKEHRTSSQIQVQVLRGRVLFSATGNSVKLQAGLVLQLEASIPHSVTAQTDAVMLLTMTPSPSFHSMERELFQQATPLVKRISEEA